MSLLDLVRLEELQAHLERRTRESFLEAPFLGSPLGPGMPWPSTIDRRRRFPLPFPAAAVPAHLVMANLVEDPQMPETLGGYDIALLDTSPISIGDLTPEGLYVVQRHGEAVLRYIRPGVRGYYLVSDATLDAPGNWERLRLSRRELMEGVKGRVRWMGRERDGELPAAQRGRFLYDAISS